MNNIVQLTTKVPTTPDTLNGKVPPRRRKNGELRSREYLTPDEVDRLMDAAGRLGRHRHRDRTLIQIAFRHALRVSELVALRWDQVDLKQGLLHVNRSKNGTPSSHPLRGPEMLALASWAPDEWRWYERWESGRIGNACMGIHGVSAGGTVIYRGDDRLGTGSPRERSYRRDHHLQCAGQIVQIAPPSRCFAPGRRALGTAGRTGSSTLAGS